jgi:glycosyltransferase involved in cell wall biosynthesis
MKRIIFLIQGENMPSSRVRVLNLLDKLKEKGYDITCQKYPKGQKNKNTVFTSLRDYDAVFVQKKLPSVFDTIMIRLFSKKLIFDFDDAIFMKHEKYKKQSSFSSRMKFKQIIKNSDLVIAGNEYLKQHAERFNDNIHIVPSVLETNNMPQRDYDNENDKFIVGWVGGNINLTQLELLNDVFKKLSEDFPMKLNVISGEAPNIEGIDMEFIPWTLDGQDAEIAKLDVGVMPLPDSPHARGKCAYKAIQYMAAGVAPVVSDVGVNAEVVADTGLVTESIDDFYDKIKYLYENKDTLKQMGKKAWVRACENYSIDFAVDKIDMLLKELLVH